MLCLLLLTINYLYINSNGATVASKSDCELIKNEIPVNYFSTNMEPTAQLQQLPQYDYIAYTMNMPALRDYVHVTRKSDDGGLTQSGHSIQFKLGRNGNTLVLFFPGTGNVPDVTTDLRISHAIRKIGTQDIHVHSGILKRLEHNSFLRALQKELFWMLADMKPHLRPTKFVISGHSLGGAYALWFFLMMYQSQIQVEGVPPPPTDAAPDYIYPNFLNQKGFKLLPKKIEDVFVISYAAPFVIFHDDTNKISDQLTGQIYNFINYKDPVPMALS
eukprot:260820_1